MLEPNDLFSVVVSGLSYEAFFYYYTALLPPFLFLFPIPFPLGPPLNYYISADKLSTYL